MIKVGDRVREKVQFQQSIYWEGIIFQVFEVKPGLTIANINIDESSCNFNGHRNCFNNPLIAQVNINQLEVLG